MHRVNFDALAVLISGAIINLRHCSSCCSRPHPDVYHVQCFIFSFTMLYL
jgi:hypothetical protein